MKNCPQCGKPTNDNDRFCNACGANLSKTPINTVAHHQQQPYINENNNMDLDEPQDYNEYVAERLIELQEDIHFELCTIRRWIVFFGVLVIVGLIASIVSIAK